MNETNLASHYESLGEFQDWSQRYLSYSRARRETRVAQREAHRTQRQALYQEICHAQFATTARRLQRLGFKVEMPLDFTHDTLASTPGFAGAGCLSEGGTALAAMRNSRFGFGLRRQDWSPAQRLNRLKLAAAWFLAVIAVFAGYLTLPGAQATADNSAVSFVSHEALFGAQTNARSAVDPNPQLDPRLNPNEQPPLIGPNTPANPANPADPGINLSINGFDKKPATAVLVFMLVTLLSVAPSLLLMMTSFTKIFIVLAMARNALGLNQIPPTQVLSGLAVFLSLFIMAPTISDVWTEAVQPYMDGKVQVQDMFKLGEKPFREFMGPLTREEDIALITRAADRPNPESLEKTPFTTLVPAFMISEVRSAFIIGFVVFIPFLVIDLVVGAALMSMGMMMLPPVMVSLPFKILLFIMVDGWGMLTQTLIGTYR